MKTCNTCGCQHKNVPSNARAWIEEGSLVGWFWECVCGSTMFKKAVGEGK